MRLIHPLFCRGLTLSYPLRWAKKKRSKILPLSFISFYTTDFNACEWVDSRLPWWIYRKPLGPVYHFIILMNIFLPVINARDSSGTQKKREQNHSHSWSSKDAEIYQVRESHDSLYHNFDRRTQIFCNEKKSLTEGKGGKRKPQQKIGLSNREGEESGSGG